MKKGDIFVFNSPGWIFLSLKYLTGFKIHVESSAFPASSNFVTITGHWLNYFHLILSNSYMRKDLSASCVTSDF